MWDKSLNKLGTSVMDELKLDEILSEERNSESEMQNPFGHDDLTKRIKRTLYYDPIKQPDTDTLSYAVTESAVSRFQHFAPMQIGKLGHRYASRVARDACISPCALLLGLIYIERLKHKNPNYLETISSSDLFLVSMMVASKYLYDEGCEDEVFNDEWAFSGETDTAKVNRLEREFLKAIDWHLYVNPQEFSTMLNFAETDIALSNGNKRGWLTYSDLRSLLDSEKIYKQLTMTAGILSKATCLCMIMYSGLVCVAALTSTVLVCFSNKSYQNQTPFGPQPYRQALVPEMGDSSSDTDDRLSGTDPELIESLASNEFSGFVYSSFPQGVRPLNRRKILPIDTYAWDNVSQPADNRNLTSGLLNEHPDSSDSLLPIPDIKQKRSSICSMLEAVFLMAHVPAICHLEQTPERCENCGKPEAKTRSKYPTCTRFRANVLSNASVRFSTDLAGPRIMPRHMPTLHMGKMNSMPGVFNPTLPPILQEQVNRTKLHRIPVIIL